MNASEGSRRHTVLAHHHFRKLMDFYNDLFLSPTLDFPFADEGDARQATVLGQLWEEGPRLFKAQGHEGDITLHNMAKCIHGSLPSVCQASYIYGRLWTKDNVTDVTEPELALDRWVGKQVTICKITLDSLVQDTKQASAGAQCHFEYHSRRGERLVTKEQR